MGVLHLYPNLRCAFTVIDIDLVSESPWCMWRCQAWHLAFASHFFFDLLIKLAGHFQTQWGKLRGSQRRKACTSEDQCVCVFTSRQHRGCRAFSLPPVLHWSVLTSAIDAEVVSVPVFGFEVVQLVLGLQWQWPGLYMLISSYFYFLIIPVESCLATPWLMLSETPLSGRSSISACRRKKKKIKLVCNVDWALRCRSN